MTRKLIVSLVNEKGSILKSSLWNSKEPMSIGHPFRWILENTSEGVRIRDLKTLKVEEFKEDLDRMNIFKLGVGTSGPGLTLRIHPYCYSDLHTGFSPKWLQTEPLPSRDQTVLFGNSLKGSTFLVIALIAISMIMPHKEVSQEELIPPQFAKLLMTPTSKGARNNSRSSNSGDEGANKVTNVVQAFKSESVQHSTQALLKGGVLALLAKSNLISNSKAPAALKSLFDQGKGAQSLSKIAGLADVTTLALGAQGGKASADGSTIGYGEGEKAGVEGQGKSFVTLNPQDSVVQEGLTKDEVGKVIHSHVSEIRYCYESAMIKNPNIQGKLIVDFVIQGKGANSGSIKSAQVHDSTLNDSSVDQCILSHLTNWKFPNPKGGVEVAVTYPFLFKSLGK